MSSRVVTDGCRPRLRFLDKEFGRQLGTDLRLGRVIRSHLPRTLWIGADELTGSVSACSPGVDVCRLGAYNTPPCGRLHYGTARRGVSSGMVGGWIGEMSMNAEPPGACRGVGGEYG